VRQTVLQIGTLNCYTTTPTLLGVSSYIATTTHHSVTSPSNRILNRTPFTYISCTYRGAYLVVDEWPLLLYVHQQGYYRLRLGHIGYIQIEFGFQELKGICFWKLVGGFYQTLTMICMNEYLSLMRSMGEYVCI